MTLNLAGASPQRPGRELALLASLAVAALSFAVVQSLVVPALPAIRHEFGLSNSETAWVLTATLLSSAVTTPVLGRLGDSGDRRRLLIATLMALALGILTSAVAPSYAWLLAGRVLQGLAGAAFPLAFGLIGEHLRAGRASTGVGVVSSMSAAGLAIGVLAAAALVDRVGFRATFWLFLIPVLAAIGLVTWTAPKSRRAGGAGVNWLAALLMCGWLTALLLAVVAVPAEGWLGHRVITWFAVSAGLALVWSVVETRSPAPLVDLRMLADPVLAGANAVSLLLGFVMYAAFANLADFGAALGATQVDAAPFGSAGFLLPWAVLSFTSGLASGPVVTRFSAPAAVSAGMAATTLALALLAGVAQPWQIVCCSGLLGLGSGLATGAVAALVIRASGPDHSGVATAVTTNARLVGGTLGTQVFSSVASMGALDYPTATTPGYRNAFLMVATASAVALVVAIATTRSSATARTRRGTPAP
ncbi:MAG TPA: MFS transporter [Micromonosporaceae bacterium]